MEQKFRVFSSAAAGMSLFVSEKAGLIHEGREGSCAKKQIIIRNVTKKQTTEGLLHKTSIGSFHNGGEKSGQRKGWESEFPEGEWTRF